MKTSIVILTYKRHAALHRCLTSIYNADKHPDNIYVVDNGLECEVKIILDNLREVMIDVNIEYVPGNNDLGVCARNLAIDKVDKGIILQCDDDATVSANWYEIVNKWFTDLKVGAIGQEATVLDGWLNYKGGLEVNSECDFLTGFLWAWRADKGWRYDEEYAPFWREESDLQCRIKKEGSKIFKCRNLGGHASHRTGDVDWPLHDNNTDRLIKKWKGKGIHFIGTEECKRYDNV